MSFLAAMAALARNDLRLIRRDAFLAGLLLFVVGVTALLRWLLPWVADFLRRSYGFDLEPYFLPFVSYIIVTMGGLPGLVIGFVLLDERDEHTLHALLVTPLPFSRYLAYRVGAPAAFAFLLTVLEGLILDLAALPFWRLVVIAVLASPLAAISALFLGAFAGDKVQGFAYMKLMAAWGFVPLAAYFVAEPWQYLAGLVPPYWALKAYWAAYAGDAAWWVYLLLGVVANVVALRWLARRFETVVHRR